MSNEGYSINDIAKDMGENPMFEGSLRDKQDLIAESTTPAESTIVENDDITEDDIVDLDGDAGEEADDMEEIVDDEAGEDEEKEECVKFDKAMAVKFMQELVSNCPEDEESCFAFIDALADKLVEMCDKEEGLKIEDWEQIEQVFIDEGLIEFDETEEAEGHDAPPVEDEVEEEEESCGSESEEEEEASTEEEEESEEEEEESSEEEEEEASTEEEEESEEEEEVAFESKVAEKVIKALNSNSESEMKFEVVSENKLRVTKANMKTLKESCQKVNEKIKGKADQKLHLQKNKENKYFVVIK